MYPSEPMWPARAAKPCLWFGLSIVCCLVFWLAMPLPAQESGICQRTLQVKDAIVAASGAATCAQVTDTHLREITVLDLRDQAIATLRANDFDGLIRLKSLDLSDNLLTSLPRGVFDELYLLKTLRLNDNLLETLPADIFRELFLLQELTLSGNRLTSLPDGLFGELSRFDVSRRTAPRRTIPDRTRGSGASWIGTPSPAWRSSSAPSPPCTRNVSSWCTDRRRWVRKLSPKSIPGSLPGVRTPGSSFRGPRIRRRRIPLESP